jgi:hypothetical protein
LGVDREAVGTGRVGPANASLSVANCSQTVANATDGSGRKRTLIDPTRQRIRQDRRRRTPADGPVVTTDQKVGGSNPSGRNRYNRQLPKHLSAFRPGRSGRAANPIRAGESRAVGSDRMPRTTSIHKYRHHKSSGRAVVTLSDGLGGRYDVQLGEYGSGESRCSPGSNCKTIGRRMYGTKSPDSLRWCFWSDWPAGGDSPGVGEVCPHAADAKSSRTLRPAAGDPADGRRGAEQKGYIHQFNELMNVPLSFPRPCGSVSSCLRQESPRAG